MRTVVLLVAMTTVSVGITLGVILIGVAVAEADQSNSSRISNATPRCDAGGNILDAHDGCLHKFGNRFYLYGTAYGKTDGFGKSNHYCCYSSADLVTWKPEGDLLTKPPKGVYYRPYVVYNAKTRKYVLWYNWYPTLWNGQYGVATSDTPLGPFVIHNANVPVSQPKPGDLGLFVDDDGTGYLIYTSIAKNHGIVVDRLADDFLSSTQENSGLLATGCEAPVLFKRQGTYYALFDNCCCFCPGGTGARVYTAAKPLGPYTWKGGLNINRDAKGVPIIHAQQTHVARLPTPAGLSYVWMGDRWGSTPDKIKGHDFQYWAPLEFGPEGNILPLRRTDEWTIDLTEPREAASSKESPGKTDLFEAGKDGYATYRIPGIVVTKRGVVLAYCAARKSGIGDWDHIDVAMRRSTDGGRSWQPSKILVDVGKTTADNPTAIVDRQTGAIHFLYQIDYARCYYMRSDDDGETFTAPKDITAVFEQFRKEYDWNVIAPGPGHGIQLDNGRLLVPVWLSTGGHQHRPSCVSTIYSDDHGHTWHRGEIVVRDSATIPNPSETVAVQLADGRVMLNIRNESRRFRRLVAFSKDGATQWTKPVFDESLFEPVCMASMVRAVLRPGQQGSRILFANPDSRNKPHGAAWCRPRESLAIKASEDEGRTWPVSRVLEPGVSGYSDLAVLPDGTILCFYERGGVGGNMFYSQYLTVARFPIEWVYGAPPAPPSRRAALETAK